MTRTWRGLVVLLGAITLTACAVQPSVPEPERQALPNRAQVTAPFFPQQTNQCGPAALASALSWSGVAITAAELADAVYIPDRQGSLQAELIAATRHQQRIPYRPAPALTGLLRELAAGHPVVVLQNLGLSWLPQWHYAVAVGYDLGAQELVLHSGERAHYRVDLGTFQRTWERAQQWALVPLPPGRLPAADDPGGYLQAASGLEEIGDYQTAAAAYTTAVERWPGHLGALLGLGNTRYKQGDLDGAARALRRAVDHHPQAGAAYNNLAHVLAEQGHRQEALMLAERALALGGPHAEAARSTLAALREDHP